MLIFLRIFTWQNSWYDRYENGPIPAKKIRQFVQDFPFALITFLCELFFLEEKERTDPRNCFFFRQKS